MPNGDPDTIKPFYNNIYIRSQNEDASAEYTLVKIKPFQFLPRFLGADKKVMILNLKIS